MDSQDSTPEDGLADELRASVLLLGLVLGGVAAMAGAAQLLSALLP